MLTDKDSLRRAMKELRSAASDRIGRDRKIYENLFTVPAFAKGGSVFLYNSFGSEADTAMIARELMLRGRQVFYPRVRGREMELVEYNGQAFERGPFGIAEPQGEPCLEIPAITVLPMLAADKRFNRLGYGGGFYDRFLAEAGDKTLKIAIGYDFQLVDELPAEEYDIPVDMLVTDTRILIRGKTEVL